MDKELLTVKMIPGRGGLVASGTMAVSLNNGFKMSVFRNYFKVTNTHIQRSLIHHSQRLDTHNLVSNDKEKAEETGSH